MHWLIYALFAVVALSISNILQRVLMKDDKSDPYTYGFLFQLLCSAVLFVFALLKGFVMPPILTMPVHFFLEALLYGAATIFLFKALQSIESSEATIITSLRSAVTVIVAVVLLGERFIAQYAFGVMLIIISVVLVNWAGKRIVYKKGMIYAAVAAICFGLAIVNDAYILRFAPDAASYAAVAFLLPALVLLVLRPQILKGLKNFFKRGETVKNMLIMSSLYAAANIAIYEAIAQGAQVSQIGPVSQSSAVVTVALAVVFLNERDRLLSKVIAVLLVFVGVALLRG